MGNAAIKVLVLEDQPLIALDIEDALSSSGFKNINVISSCADAEKWLESNNPDFAVIDVHLRDGICSNVAQILVDNDVPFIVHSALDTHYSGDGSIFTKGRWLSKPSPPGRLAFVVQETLGAS